MALRVPRMRQILSIAATGLILTVLFSLFARYEPSNPYHLIYNGLPLPTFVQVIDPTEGSVVAIQPDLQGILFDLVFFSVTWVVLSFALEKIRARFHKG